MTVSRDDYVAAIEAMSDLSYRGKQLTTDHCQSLLDLLISDGWEPKRDEQPR